MALSLVKIIVLVTSDTQPVLSVLLVVTIRQQPWGQGTGSQLFSPWHLQLQGWGDLQGLPTLKVQPYNATCDSAVWAYDNEVLLLFKSSDECDKSHKMAYTFIMMCLILCKFSNLHVTSQVLPINHSLSTDPNNN